MIVEMAGRPAEHVKESMTKHAGILYKLKDIHVHSIQVSEPKEIENSQGLFTCFSEIDFETQSFARLSEIILDFMPSSVEVVNPSEIKINLQETTNLLNNISGRMHKYDEIAKLAHFRIRQLEAQLQETQKTLMDKDKS